MRAGYPSGMTVTVSVGRKGIAGVEYVYLDGEDWLTQAAGLVRLGLEIHTAWVTMTSVLYWPAWYGESK